MPQITTSSWMPIGPAPIQTEGGLIYISGRINAAAPHPSDSGILYVVADNGGVWRTGGATQTPPAWQPLTDSMPSLSSAYYHLLWVGQSEASPILGVVSGPGGGILKSTDTGDTWILLANDQFEGATLSSIAVDPDNPLTLYVAANLSTGGSSAYKSVDGGSSWEQLTGLVGGFVSDLILDVHNPTDLYAGVTGNWGATPKNGIYKSTDGGGTWRPVMKDLPAVGPSDTVRLELGPTQGLVYAVLLLSGAPQRYKTDNGGRTWTALQPSGGQPENRWWHLLIGVDPKNAKHLFVNDSYSIYESIDAGTSWVRADTNIGYLKQINHFDWVNIAFDANDDVIFTADQGVYRYRPTSGQAGGGEWTSLVGNLEVSEFYTVTLDPNDAETAYAVGQDIFSEKFEGSLQWIQLQNGINEMGKYLVDLSDSNVIYAYDPRASTDFVVRSSDGGQTFATIYASALFGGGSTLPTVIAGAGAGTGPTIAVTGNDTKGVITLTTGSGPSEGTIASVTFGSAFSGIPSLQISPGNAAATALGSRTPSETCSASGFTLLAGTAPLSPNTEYMWNFEIGIGSLDGDTQKSFVMDQNDSSRLLLGMTQVMQTTNALDLNPTWTPISDVLSKSQYISEQYISALAMGPSGTVYAATVDGHVWVTHDEGEQWQECDAGLSGAVLIGICVNPKDGTHAFAISSSWANMAVWELTTSVAPFQGTWQCVSSTLPSELTGLSLCVDWNYRVPVLYVGTDRNLYHSTDGGNSWTKFGLDLPNTLIYDIQSGSIGPDAKTILAAATYGRGAWEMLIEPSTISGMVYGYGTWKSPDGPGVFGVPIYLDQSGKMPLEEAAYVTSTDLFGRYVVKDIPPGTYTVRHIPWANSRPVGLADVQVTVNGSNLTDVNFADVFRGKPPSPPTAKGASGQQTQREQPPPWGP